MKSSDYPQKQLTTNNYQLSTIISSRQNQKISHFRALMRDKKARTQSGMFAVEGEKLFYEAVSSGLLPIEILITEKNLQNNNKFYEYAAKICNIEIITGDLAEYISDTKSPSGIFFTLAMLDKSVNMNTINSSGEKNGVSLRRFIALDGVQDPGNVGAVIRSCDAFGIDGLFLSEACADVNSPKVIRSAMGSAFRLPVYRGNLTDILTQMKNNGFNIIGANLKADAENLSGFAFGEKCVVVIGAEGAGISAEVLSLCDSQIYIPIKNAESLNAAVAASIIMYEMRKKA